MQRSGLSQKLMQVYITYNQKHIMHAHTHMSACVCMCTHAHTRSMDTHTHTHTHTHNAAHCYSVNKFAVCNQTLGLFSKSLWHAVDIINPVTDETCGERDYSVQLLSCIICFIDLSCKHCAGG